MTESLHLSTLARLVEELVSSQGPSQRDRLLLDAVFELEAAQAAAIWRPVPAPGSNTRGPDGVWGPVLERGPVDALPARSQVDGVLAGELERNLPGRGVVLRPEEEDVALVLGEVENPDGRVDLLEALMLLGRVLALTDACLEERQGEGLAAPLPGAEQRPGREPEEAP